MKFDGLFGNSDGLKESRSRKSTSQVRPRSSCAIGSKACREKMRRDRLNDRFMELGALLDSGRPPTMEKSAMLTDALKVVNQLQDEAQNSGARFFAHPPAIPSPFSSPRQVVGSKLLPFVGYPGALMWRLMPPASVDTSKDPVLRSPAA
ncbi:hypothetical protein P3X46_020479 [Hevea brasiliensis]|uniref:BHLH domain-containing protein n=1 Tax=Hevea brasiliensis TaxID=3981 RepID=A0ABQ9LM09_HEVBR|nr:hypothetical protein P3X46_020479 [Hevea brasiliensis]